MLLLRFKDTPRRKKVTTRSYPRCQAAAFGVSNHFPSAELKVMSKVPRVPKQTPKNTTALIFYKRFAKCLSLPNCEIFASHILSTVGQRCCEAGREGEVAPGRPILSYHFFLCSILWRHQLVGIMGSQ